jgi:hypothetical protein
MSTCKKCKNEISKKYREKNKKIETLKIQARNGYKICTMCNRELPLTDEYFYRGRDKKTYWSPCKECKKKYYNYAYNNPEKAKENQINWAKKNKDNHKFCKHRKRAKDKSLKADLTIEQWQEIKLNFNNKCCYCGEELELELEHFIPLSKNGEFTYNNILPSCRQCNKKKGVEDFFNWYPRQEFYDKKREEKILKHIYSDIKNK